MTDHRKEKNKNILISISTGVLSLLLLIFCFTYIEMKNGIYLVVILNGCIIVSYLIIYLIINLIFKNKT